MRTELKYNINIFSKIIVVVRSIDLRYQTITVEKSGKAVYDIPGYDVVLKR